MKHYYSGITLATEPFILSGNSTQKYYSQTFFAPEGKASLVIDNKYKVSYIDISVNGVDEKVTFDTSDRYNVLDLSNFLHNGLNTVEFNYPISLGQNKGLRMYIELVEKNGK